jgi:hypothetical protein
MEPLSVLNNLRGDFKRGATGKLKAGPLNLNADDSRKMKFGAKDSFDGGSIGIDSSGTVAGKRRRCRTALTPGIQRQVLNIPQDRRCALSAILTARDWISANLGGTRSPSLLALVASSPTRVATVCGPRVAGWLAAPDTHTARPRRDSGREASGARRHL